MYSTINAAFFLHKHTHCLADRNKGGSNTDVTPTDLPDIANYMTD